MKSKCLRVMSALLLIAVLCIVSACNAGEAKSDGDRLFSDIRETKRPLLSLATPEPTPEPTPVPLPLQFKAGLQAVLNDAVIKSDRLSEAGLGALFDPGGEAQSKSARVVTSISITQPGEDAQKMNTVSLTDIESGDASFSISAVQGEETAGEGAMYFIGDTMLLKRADASKPMIRFSPDAALAASYKNESALFRAALALGKDTKPVQSTEEWSERVTAFSDIVVQQSSESDYTNCTADISLPGGSSVTTQSLSLSGESARAVLAEFVALLHENGSLSGMVNGMATADQEETGTLRLDTMKNAIQAGETQLTADILFCDGQAVGINLAYTIDGGANALRLLFYEKGFEKQNEIAFAFSDGANMALSEHNENAGGDSYTGEIKMKSAQPGGEGSDLTIATTSTHTDTLYALDATVSLTLTVVNDGTPETKTVPMQIAWKQQKNASGGEDATGTIVITDPDEGDQSNIAIEYSKTYEAVTLNAPQFMEGSGIDAASREDVLAQLDMEAEQFDEMPVYARGLMLLMALGG